MVRLIMSGKGEGKTKQLIELMNAAAETETCCMVCIEASRSIAFSLRSQVRMIDAGEYQLNNFDTLRGFISGLYAGNYDITNIFFDNLSRIVKNPVVTELEAFLQWLDSFGEANHIKFVATLSGDPDTATDVMKRYM